MNSAGEKHGDEPTDSRTRLVKKKKALKSISKNERMSIIYQSEKRKSQEEA